MAEPTREQKIQALKDVLIYGTSFFDTLSDQFIDTAYAKVVAFKKDVVRKNFVTQKAEIDTQIAKIDGL